MKNLHLNLLSLRAKQAYRAFQKTGFGLVLFALLIVSGVAFKGIEGLLQFNPYYILLFAMVVLVSLDFQRTDKLFLGRIFRDKKRLITLLFLEYFLLLSPFVFFQLTRGHFLIAFLLGGISLLVAGLSPLLKKPIDKGLKTSLSFLPLQNFEIKFNIEKRKTTYALAYVLCFLGAYHFAFFVVGIVVIGLLLLDAFKEIESRELLHWQNRFVLKKVFSNAQLLALFITPPTVLTFLFQSEFYLVLIYALVVLFSFLLLAISYKYSNYNPLYKSQVNDVVVGLFSLISILPGGIIITLSFALWSYFKAEKLLRSLMNSVIGIHFFSIICY